MRIFISVIRMKSIDPRMVSLFPLKGGAINVEVDIQSHGQLLTLEGKNIESGAFAQGGNSLQFWEGEGMASGTYLLVIINATDRIVIE